MPEDTTLARSSEWSAERSTFVADVLRGGNRSSSRVRLRVHGESMLPALWPGNVVEIASCPLEDIRPGEIVLALRDDRLFLHRLVAVQPNGFLLRGDSMPGRDPRSPPEALLGRLVLGAGKGRGYISSVCSRAAGMLLCHCGVIRRLALKLHSRRTTSAREFRSVESL